MKIYKKQKLTASVFLYNKYRHCGNKSKAVFLLKVLAFLPPRQTFFDPIFVKIPGYERPAYI